MPKPVNRKSVAQHNENATVAAEDEVHVHVHVSMANAARDLEEKDIPVSFNGSKTSLLLTFLGTVTHKNVRNPTLPGSQQLIPNPRTDFFNVAGFLDFRCHLTVFGFPVTSCPAEFKMSDNEQFFSCSEGDGSDFEFVPQSPPLALDEAELPFRKCGRRGRRKAAEASAWVEATAAAAAALRRSRARCTSKARQYFTGSVAPASSTARPVAAATASVTTTRQPARSSAFATLPPKEDPGVEGDH